MKQNTKRYLGIAAVSALVIGVTGGVLAQGGFGPGSGPGWGGHQGMMSNPGGMHRFGGGPGGMMGSDPAAFTDQRLTELKSTIDVTDEQESVWNTYADAVKSQVGVMQSHRQLMFGSEPITPDQRLAFHQQGLDQMQKMATASRDLYSTLTPEQQTRAGNLTGMHHAMR